MFLSHRVRHVPSPACGRRRRRDPRVDEPGGATDEGHPGELRPGPHPPSSGLTRGPGGGIDGVTAVDAETGSEFRAAARVVVNAAGPFCDDVRHLADPAAPPLLAASRGSHVVLDRSFLPGDTALLVPETPDGRVLFAIPFHGRTLVGTTDVPIEGSPERATATEPELRYLLDAVNSILPEVRLAWSMFRRYRRNRRRIQHLKWRR